MSIDSGVYPLAQRTQLLQRPESILQLEAEFASQLVSLLDQIYNHGCIAERWYVHAYTIAVQLEISPSDFDQVLTGRQTASKLVRQKQYGERFSKTVVEVAKELERLLMETQNLRVSGRLLFGQIFRFGGPLLERFGATLSLWLDINAEELFGTLRFLLSDTVAASKIEMPHRLALYLDFVLKSLPLFPFLADESGVFSPKGLDLARRLCGELAEAGARLRRFTAQPTRAFFLFVQHELALIEAVLPRQASASDWFLNFTRTSSGPASTLLPEEIRLDGLPEALNEAELSLAEMENEVKQAESALREVERLVEHIQSPTAARFLKAMEERILLYHSWHPRLLASLRGLQKAVQL
jgi:hypothetical protein